MGEKWQRERDARVAEAKRRLATPYTTYDAQMKMVREIKAPMMDAILTLLSPAGKVEKLKALRKLRRAAGALGEFPEPTIKNTWNPNTHRLIDARDEFFLNCHLDEGRKRVMRLGIKMVIIVYDSDPPYRMMIDWWAKQFGVANWEYDIPYKLVNYNWPWWTGPGGRQDAPVVIKERICKSEY